MKRFAILLVFVLLVAGAIFFFGWIQMRVPPDGYGVVFTRTHGWEDDVIEPGTFAWRWQGLIPTNLSLYVFESQPHRTPIGLSGTLPSGREIDAILDGSGAFSYDVRLVVQSRIIPGALPSLARDRDLRPERIDEYYRELDARIAQAAEEAIMTLVGTHPERLSLDEHFQMIVDEVTGRIERQVEHVEIVAVTPERIELPDLQLYLTARELAMDVLRARATARREAAAQLATLDAQAERRFEQLERYGEILERYPVLLEYFRVGQDGAGEQLSLNAIIPPPE